MILSKELTYISGQYEFPLLLAEQFPAKTIPPHKFWEKSTPELQSYLEGYLFFNTILNKSSP